MLRVSEKRFYNLRVLVYNNHINLFSNNSIFLSGNNYRIKQ
jgi:hypothetical protein